MTIKQFRKACDIARRYGEAKLDDGSILCYHGPSYGWAIRSKNGNTVATAYDPKKFEYLFD